MIIYSFDGGGPRRPGGVCGWGWAAWKHGEEVAYGQGGLSATTNNVAEYIGLTMAMTHALACEYPTDVEFMFQGDSMLVLQQVAGEWKVKAEHLRPHRDYAHHLWNGLGQPRLHWVPREENARADMLASQGRDSYEVTLDHIARIEAHKLSQQSAVVGHNHTVRTFKRR